MAKKVLVVDDEKLIVKGIRFALEQDGYEVTCAYDGEEALQYAKETEFDLILLDRASGEFYGRVFIETAEEVNAQGETVKVEYAGVEFGNGASDRRGPYGTYRTAKNGAFVAARTNSAGTAFVMMERLTKVDNVSSASWIGDKSVVFGGRSYAVPEEVLCYNEDSGRWTDLTAARNYGGVIDLYVKDGVVRVVAYASK